MAAVCRQAPISHHQQRLKLLLSCSCRFSACPCGLHCPLQKRISVQQQVNAMLSITWAQPGVSPSPWLTHLPSTFPAPHLKTWRVKWSLSPCSLQCPLHELGISEQPPLSNPKLFMRNAGHWWHWVYSCTAVFSLPVAVSVEFPSPDSWQLKNFLITPWIELSGLLPVLMPSSAQDSDSPHMNSSTNSVSGDQSWHELLGSEGAPAAGPKGLQLQGQHHSSLSPAPSAAVPKINNVSPNLPLHTNLAPVSQFSLTVDCLSDSKSTISSNSWLKPTSKEVNSWLLSARIRKMLGEKTVSVRIARTNRARIGQIR